MFKFLLFFLPAYSLFAITTLTVTLSSDNNPGGIGDVGDTPDRGDLRYCLNTMNANLNASLDDYYQIAFAFPMTIQLNGILPIINNSSNLANITIGNSDPSYRVVIDGNDGAYRGFFIPKGIVTIQNIVFQNMCAQGGTGGDGISGGGGGMGAGGAIYAPQLFLNGSSPSIRLMNVLINSCSAIGGAGGNYSADSITGNEGGGGGGGFSGNGGSVTTSGVTGGAGGGGFGGDGGNVTLSTESISGGGGGGGGGGSGLGGAIFVDSGLNFTIQALPGVPTNFDTTNTSTTAGNPGVGAPGAADGSRGFALGNSIFLRSTSTLTLLAENEDDLLILGEGVSFVDDTEFILEGTTVEVTGNGTIIYNGATTYSGTLHINNANFKLNGIINDTSVSVSRDISYSAQRGKLSGRGTLTGSVKVNSGIISPDANQTLTLGSLILNSANPDTNTLESIVHAEINSAGTSLISVTGAVALAGTLEIDLDRTALPGTYILLTSSGITNTFDSISFVGPTPNYSISYLPRENPTFIQFELKAPPLLNLQGAQMKNTFAFEYELYNELTWGPSLSNQTIGYFIFRDGEKIATLDAQTTTYLDHNRKKNLSYTYSITSFDASGNESIPETITINP